MAQVNLQGMPVHLSGQAPELGQPAADFALTRSDFQSFNLNHFKGKALIIMCYPSLELKAYAEPLRALHEQCKARDDLLLLGVSMDLPFTLARMKEANQLEKVVLLSDYKIRQFGQAYGVLMQDGPMAGLLANAAFVFDHNHKLVYAECVEEVVQPMVLDNLIFAATKLQGKRDA